MSAEPSTSTSERGRLGLAAVAIVLVVVPFLLVRFPPITDLPQHAAQIRLFGEALGEHADLYRIQWLTPYGLSYVLPAVGWLLGGPAWAGRLGFLLVVALWVGAVHWLAVRLRRPASAAVLASALVFNHTLYWGFLSFLFGWVVFVVWLRLTEVEPDARCDWRAAARLLGGAALLYFSHVLWFAMGCLWLVVDGWRARLPWREQFLRGLAVSPVGLLALWWYPTLGRRGFDSPVYWPASVWARFGPSGLKDAVLGGLRGNLEPVFLLVVLGWLLLAAWQHRAEGRAAWSPRLLLLAGVLFLPAAVLPMEAQNTIHLAERWMPCAVVALLLAAPAPRLPAALVRWLPVAALTLFVAGTSVYWIAFSSVELDGLAPAVAALPEKPRVLGLSYYPESLIIRGNPFIQDFAYAQVMKGGELNFSFADFAPSLVVYRTPRSGPWTLGLEWLPNRVRISDFAYFDWVIASGDEAIHRHLVERAGLVPVTSGTRWRLYRVPEALRARRQSELGGALPPAATPVASPPASGSTSSRQASQ
ncbi:MAG: hypothetical protein ACM3OB_10070 [Acidobacteriota bacterium]